MYSRKDAQKVTETLYDAKQHRVWNDLLKF